MEKVAVLTIQWSTQVPWKLRSAIETCSFVLFKGIFKATEKDNTLFQGIIQTPEQVKKKKKKEILLPQVFHYVVTTDALTTVLQLFPFLFFYFFN